MSICVIKWNDQSLFYTVAYTVSVMNYNILSPKRKEQELHKGL